MRRQEVRWERMFPDELEQAFGECPLVYFPYGLCEPHWPHCALGMDGLTAHAVACWAAQEGGDIIAPCLPLFETMQVWEGDEPPAGDSVWRTNWPIPTLPLTGGQGEAE